MIFAMAIIAGGDSGIGINTGHRLGHKNTKLEKWLAKIVLAVPTYAHFSTEHNKGHHKYVSSPEDPASSRMRESIYSFTLREMAGTTKQELMEVGGWKTASAVGRYTHQNKEHKKKVASRLDRVYEV